MPSKKAHSIFLRLTNGEHESFRMNLDAHLSPGDWERRILQEGFRTPEGSMLHNVAAVSVTPILGDGPSHEPIAQEVAKNDHKTSLAWLVDQVSETCARALE